MAFEYLPGVTVNRELCQEIRVYPLIARMMAKIHKINFKEDQSSSKVPRLWPLIEQLIGLMPEKFSIAERESR